MDAAEFLRLISVKSCNLNPTGGTPTITWQDVSAALARIDNPHVRNLLSAKYCLDHKSEIRLRKSLLSCLMKKFKRTDIKVMCSLAYVLVYEFVDHCRCHTCNGRGQAVINDLLIICTSCAGSCKRQIDYFGHAKITPSKYWWNVIDYGKSAMNTWEYAGLCEVSAYVKEFYEN